MLRFRYYTDHMHAPCKYGIAPYTLQPQSLIREHPFTISIFSASVLR